MSYLSICERNEKGKDFRYAIPYVCVTGSKNKPICGAFQVKSTKQIIKAANRTKEAAHQPFPSRGCFSHFSLKRKAVKTPIRKVRISAQRKLVPMIPT